MKKKGTWTFTVSRRKFMKSISALAALMAMEGCKSKTFKFFFQKYFRELSTKEKKKILVRLEKDYTETYGKPVTVAATAAAEGVKFGYALDLSRCIGCRRCVYGCVEENNQSRTPQIQWITVLEMEKSQGVDVNEANLYYNPSTVPQKDKFYFPIACQHCENPPCVKACPVKATWKDKDGIVVIDYNWCIGCRYCFAACPYQARRFNWKKPSIPSKELNPQTEYFGNRPRYKGIVEKCTFCLQRVRKGMYPKCVEVCPVGARKFGNLLDPDSEIRYIIEKKRIFIFKEELNTHPKFFYYYGT